MNPQPNQSQFQPKGYNGGPPPTPTGPSRLLPWMKTVATGGLLVAGGLYAAQLLLPHDLKPSVVAGRGAGDTLVGEMETMRAMKLEFERQIADATAQANAKAHVDEIAIQAALAARTESLQANSVMAGLSDVLCLGAKIVSDVTRPQGWGPMSSNDPYFVAQRTGAATCGEGDKVRQGIVQSQLDAVRTAAAARGAPMMNGAIQEVAAPPAPAVRPQPVVAPPPLPHSLDDVYAISTASRHYPWEDVMKTRTYIRTLPEPVQEKLFARLTEDDDWDVLVERTHAYLVVAAIK